MLKTAYSVTECQQTLKLHHISLVVVTIDAVFGIGLEQLAAFFASDSSYENLMCFELADDL
jgi:hypothetical protein